MIDEPFYSPTRKPRVRQPKPGERLWTMTKGAHVYAAELRDHGDVGCELQFLLDGELRTGKLFPSRAAAVAEAETRRPSLRKKGWNKEH